MDEEISITSARSVSSDQASSISGFSAISVSVITFPFTFH